MPNPLRLAVVARSHFNTVRLPFRRCGSSARPSRSVLSILTTSFKEGKDRHTALGVWGGVADSPPPPACCSAVSAPNVGWGNARTIGELAGALVLLTAFVVNERRHRNPLAPLSIFRINGLGFSDITQPIAFAGFLAMFFLLTLYMQTVLGYTPIQSGAAYLPLCFAIGISAGISSQLLSRIGTRPVIVAGVLISAAGMYWLSRIPVHGSFLSDLLPGMLMLSLGFGPVFVGVTTAANAGVPADKAGLSASLLNASQQLGGALGLAIFTAVATTRTHHLLVAHTPMAHALTAGFQQAVFVGSIFILAAAVIGLRATNTRGEEPQPIQDGPPEPARA